MTTVTESAVACNPFDAIPVTIQQRRDLGSGPKRLYGALCSAQRMGWSPSYVDLAERLACSVRSIVRWVAQLVAAGLIAYRRRGQGLVNVLRVLALVTSGHDRAASTERTAWRGRQGDTSFNNKKRTQNGIYRAPEPSEYLMTSRGLLAKR